ncbi:hypothetical protein Vretifemale_3125 [Volvox reticuliferus]|uniref:Flagellar associated protein n=1 Tax=Volvox reticuliferus TaxID=1737510 RepID=A0A8J4FFQ2_9CHLO|nr:hypothetical protein Vretifemale_3125 [Volvox reticuliferus]
MAVHDSQNPFVKQPWGRPSGRSMFGKQADSKKTNSPAFSMGGSRESREKIFLSQSHVEIDRKCREGPGHIYNVPGALDRQAEARKETAASYSFPQTARLKASLRRSYVIYRCLIGVSNLFCGPFPPAANPEYYTWARDIPARCQCHR